MALTRETVKEFDFNGKDFERVRAMIYKRAGIALADSKQEMVYSRLARRLPSGIGARRGRRRR